MKYNNNRTIVRKTLLYKSGVEYADYCLNHVEGCSHGCKYPCYAFLMKKRCGIIQTYSDWCKPKIVANAIELLEKEIPKYKKKIKFVHLCFSTDPFMFEQNAVSELSLRIIDILNRNNLKVTTLTKGLLPQELLFKNGFSHNNEYGVSLVSLDENFRDRFEPNTASYKSRIKSLYYLHKKGYKTYISMEPYPTPNIINQDIKEILDSINFVDKIIFGRMNYSKNVSDFKGYKEYYNKLAKYVIEYCNNNKIGYHIKEKTITGQQK